jgi:hypothetical protein
MLVCYLIMLCSRVGMVRCSLQDVRGCGKYTPLQLHPIFHVDRAGIIRVVYIKRNMCVIPQTILALWTFALRDFIHTNFVKRSPHSLGLTYQRNANSFIRNIFRIKRTRPNENRNERTQPRTVSTPHTLLWCTYYIWYCCFFSIIITIFSLLSLFWKTGVSLWDHVAVCVCPLSLLGNGSVEPVPR